VSYSRTCKGSQVGYRTNPGGDIITSILAGEGPWFQNACTTPLGANANAPANTSTALPRSHPRFALAELVIAIHPMLTEDSVERLELTTACGSLASNPEY